MPEESAPASMHLMEPSPPMGDTPKAHAPRGRIKAAGGAPDPLPARCRATRCRATSKQTGLPCKQAPSRGGYVCRFHGGHTPQTKAAAARRWSEALVPIAVRRMGELAEDTAYPSTSFSASRFILESEYGKAAETVSMDVTGAVDVVAVLRARRARAALPDAGAVPAAIVERGADDTDA